ncbi:MAG: hypothetical protein ACR2OZ_09745 [Verrucomicrobiales bacterium]
MTQAVARIIDEVERLTAMERIELRRLIAQRVPMTDDLSDDDFATVAAESFRALDAEEDAKNRA